MTSSTKSPGLSRGFSLRTSFQRLEPVVHILVNLILGETVALLQLAFELLAPAFDHVEIVVGELAPFLLGGTLELLPVAFDPVPIHRLLLLVEMTIQRMAISDVPGTGAASCLSGRLPSLPCGARAG